LEEQTMETIQAVAIQVRKLTPVFGAEITGVDLRALDDATFAEIEEAFETYSVLVFPEQALDDDQQIAFSRRFGELEKTQGHIANNFTVKHVSVISNLDPEGKLMAADDPRLQYRLGQRNWHSDSSFKSVPAKASLLHARLLPPDGGETQFASLRAAYDALPDERKRELEPLVAIHHYAYSRRGLGFKLTNEDEDKRFPPVPQAIIRTNQKNGRKALYVGSHASHIRGMPEEAGNALLKELLEFATQEKFTYMHHWRVGDLVMYDNRAALHRARPYAITTQPRVLHRTTVAGEGPTVAE
jgi:alpha-ketoglutarate-dependent 2,4-dichlorophenoxyacetate dioxygenase